MHLFRHYTFFPKCWYIATDNYISAGLTYLRDYFPRHNLHPPFFSISTFQYVSLSNDDLSKIICCEPLAFEIDTFFRLSLLTRYNQVVRANSFLHRSSHNYYYSNVKNTNTYVLMIVKNIYKNIPPI